MEEQIETWMVMRVKPVAGKINAVSGSSLRGGLANQCM